MFVGKCTSTKVSFMAGKLDVTPHVSAEKLYQVEHPRLVSQFDDVVSLEGDEHGYYISKAWLKAKGLEDVIPNHLKKYAVLD